MMAWVSGNEINILLDQPITQEMLKGLNRPYAARVGQHVPHDEPPRMWCSMTSSIRKNAFARLRVVKNRNTSQHLWIVFGFI